MEETIVQSVPQSMQKKAKLLLEHIKTVDSIEWYSKGEHVVDKQTLPATNVLDLVNDALRDRKRFVPEGIHFWCVETSNEPNNVIGNTKPHLQEKVPSPKRWKLLSTYKRYMTPSKPVLAGVKRLVSTRNNIQIRNMQMWLQTRDVYTLHKPICVKKCSRRRVVISGLLQQYQADLLSVINIKKLTTGIVLF